MAKGNALDYSAWGGRDMTLTGNKGYGNTQGAHFVQAHGSGK